MKIDFRISFEWLLTCNKLENDFHLDGRRPSKTLRSANKRDKYVPNEKSIEAARHKVINRKLYLIVCVKQWGKKKSFVSERYEFIII